MTKLRPAPNSVLNLALAVLTGVLLVSVFPPYNFAWLAPFALAPLLISLAREPRPLFRFLLGYLAGNVYWFGLCSWIQFVLEVHGGMGRWGGWGTFLLFCLLKSLHLGVFALLAAIVARRWYAIPAIAALWTGLERTHGDFGFAWLCLGNAGIDLALPLRLAPWTGVYGISFLFVMMSAAASGVALRRARKELLWLAVIPALLALPAMPDPQPGQHQAVLVQPNIPEDIAWTPSQSAELQNMLARRSLEAALQSNSRLIIWPEAPAPLYYFRDLRFRRLAEQLSRDAHAWLLFGTVANNPQGAPLNSAVLLSPKGELVDRYDKINLVPFGEFVPEAFSFVNRVTQEAGDFAAGTRVVELPMDGKKLGTFICYESAFPHGVRQFAKGGADLLVNISNDGYFGHSAARDQHLEIVRMRAAENRRWVLRATNNGVTAAIDPGGRVTQLLPGFTEATGTFRYSFESATTFYTVHGDCFAWSCWLLGLAALVSSQWPHYARSGHVGYAESRRKPGSPSPATRS